MNKIRFIIMIMAILITFIFIQKNKAEDPTESTDMKDKMKIWSRQLGVTCNYCHNLENFKDGNMESYKTSLKHQQSVTLLQEQIFNERDKANILKIKVDCFMCHRGKDKPLYIEPPMTLIK